MPRSWRIFADIQSFLNKGEHIAGPTGQELAEVILEHGRLLMEYKGEHIAVREMRKHTAWYTAGLYNSARFRRNINEMNTYEELKEAVYALTGRLGDTR